MAANDIRTFDDPSETGVGSLNPQRLGVIHVKSGRTSNIELGGIDTTPSGANSASDPNNVINKYDARLDDYGYYV